MILQKCLSAFYRKLRQSKFFLLLSVAVKKHFFCFLRLQKMSDRFRFRNINSSRPPIPANSVSSDFWFWTNCIFFSTCAPSTSRGDQRGGPERPPTGGGGQPWPGSDRRTSTESGIARSDPRQQPRQRLRASTSKSFG